MKLLMITTTLCEIILATGGTLPTGERLIESGDLINRQKSWPEGHNWKGVDFSLAPYWLLPHSRRLTPIMADYVLERIYPNLFND